jgi:parallel beta-helix repeat protein
MKIIQKKIKPVLILAVISLILIAPNFAEEKNLDILNHPINAGNHDPISINGNSELATFISNEGLNGEGTEISPYIIESLIIDSSSTNGFNISNTDAFLIIRNCTIQGLDQESIGIYCNNTENININTNQIAENAVGIQMTNSLNLNISENSVIDCRFGIKLSNSNNSMISQNSINLNFIAGIYLFGSNYNAFLDNTVINNYYNGYYIGNSNSNTFSGTVANNGDKGFRIQDSSNNKFFKNSITNNSKGISIFSSDNNEFYFNNIYENHDLEALEGDTCTNNKWDNGTAGNYWGNYTERYPEANKDGSFWDTPYEIDGDGLGMDNFPFVKPIEFDDSKNILGFPVLSIIIFISIGVFLLRRKVRNQKNYDAIS